MIDLLFPKLCLGCSCLGTYLCSSCSKKLKFIDRETCLYCHKASALGLTHPGCMKNFYIDGLLSIYTYDNLLKKIIKSIKYRLATEVFREFIKTIRPEALIKFCDLKKILKNGVLEPIPLSSLRFKARGFNQAAYVALYFKKILNLPISELLVRKKNTLAQAQLQSKASRFHNLKGAFIISDRNKLIPETVILVDDVVTTGATVKEACRVLKKNGAQKVFVLALARGFP